MTLQVNSTTVNDIHLNNNVGYTIQGTGLSIVNGIVSGFSSSDRLKLTPSLVFAANDNIEYNFVFTTGQSIGTEWIFGYLTGSLWSGIYITSTKVNIPFTRYNDTNYYCSVDYSLQTSTAYRINVKRINGTVTSALYDSSDTLLASNTNNIPYEVSSANNTIGTNPSYSYGGAFTGSIDLNSTYIKVNGVTWFNGKETASSTVNEVYYNKNCGYTVVGSPTISDGIVSGFSSSDYVKTSSALNWGNVTNYEVVIRAKHNDTTTNNALVGTSIGTVGDWKILFSKSLIRFILSRTTDSIEITNNFGTDYYYIRVRYNNATATVDYSTDDILYQGAVTKTFTELSTRTESVTFGYLSNYASYFDGIIDFNNTYIKVNGITWFNGKQQASNAVWTRGV